MKIVALLPVKNEVWSLPSYISSVSKVANEIIALDDNSTDDSTRLLKEAGAYVFKYNFGFEKVVNMSRRRTVLLEKGRERGGTHFIWLDADETFSANFVDKAKEFIAELQPGEKLSMRWIHAWKDTDHYLNDQKSPLGKIWKDFIVYDDRKMVFGDQFLSEARTPGSNQSTKQLPDTAGVVLHWQFARWNITQYKQALYRCLELLEGNRSARRINNTYSITLDNQELKTEPIPYIWTEDVIMPETQTANVNSYKEQIIALFNLHGVEKFEPLQIWHISELRKLFIKTVGREPIPSLAPKWLLKLNDIKNLIKKHV